MNLKKMLVTGALAMGPFGQQAEHVGISSLENSKINTENEIAYVLASSQIPKDTASCYTLGETIRGVLDEEGEVIIRRPLEEMKKTPLTMSKVSKNFGTLLGYNQADLILKNYNPGKQLYGFHRYELLDTLNFPLIYPELKKFFPENLNDLFDLESFSSLSDKIDVSESIVAIQQVDSGKHALGFYKNNELILSTYVSVGKGQSTPTGIFPAQRKIAYCWSEKHDAPMPYGIEFISPKYFLHQGLVNGTPLSHGCVRVPGLYEEVLYALVDNHTRIVLSPTLYKKSHSLRSQ